MPSTLDLSAVRAVSLERLRWSREALEGLLAAVPDEHLFARAAGRGNHAAWVMGHLAVTDDFCVSLMDGRPHVLDESLHKRFGSGAEPTGPDDHPSRDELADAMGVARRRLVSWYESLDQEGLARPAPEFIRPLFPDAMTLPLATVGHEMFHAGQIAAVRAALGLPRRM